MNFRQAALTLAAFLGSIPASARAGTIWTAVASEKIRPNTAARSTSSAEIAAAKNEFESFQVVVTGPAKGVSASASDLTGPGTISGVKLFREELINLTTPSAADGGTGQYPDALVPDVDDVVGEKRNAFPFDVGSGESRAIWVEVHVPQDAAAGTYHGTVTIHADGNDTAVPVTLVVWDFALPSTASLKSAFGLGWVTSKLHNLPAGDAASTLRARYAQLALDHRISLHSFWDDEGLSKDWNHFDQFYGALADGNAPTQLKGAKLTSISTGANPTSTSELADWASHFKSHGWFDRLFQYTCDEPPITCQWSDIPARAQAAKAADPAFRTLVTTNVSDATKNGVLDSIDLLTPVVNQMDDRATSWTTAGNQRSTYNGFLSGTNKELWMYESCMSHGCGGTVDMGNPSADQLYFTGWPSYMVDASSTRARALEWFSFQWGMKGELYYETVQAYYARDPWTDGVFDFNGNGDGTLFYPGTPGHIGGQTDIPVASIRLKMIREGMEDFEYLKLMSDLGDAAGAKAIAQQLFPHPYQSDVSPADLMAAREAIAHRILELMHKPVPAAVTATPGSSLLVAGMGGGCGSTADRSGLLSMSLVPLALVALRLRRRRRS